MTQKLTRWDIQSRYVRDNRSGSLPGHIVLLAVEPEKRRADNDPHQFSLTIRQGVATSFRFEDCKISRRKTHEFASPDFFWPWFVGLLDTRRTTWVFGHDLGRSLSLIDLWGKIDDGTFSIERWGRKCQNQSESAATATGQTESQHARFNPRPCPNAAGKEQSPILCTTDPPLIVRCYACSSGATVTFVDSQNYWPRPPVTRLKPEKISAKSNAALNATDSDSQEQLRDSLSVLESRLTSTLRLWRNLDLGMWRWTASGLAMAAYRHRFMPENLLRHECSEARAIERAGYYGGQTEAYFIGERAEQLYHLDVSALFPSVMASEKYPLKILECVPKCDPPAKIPPMISPENSIAIVRLSTRRRTYPLRPIPSQTLLTACGSTYRQPNIDLNAGSVVYAAGDFITSLTGPELYDATNNGEIKEWYAWTTYEMSDLFSQYVDFCWKLRMSAEAQSNSESSSLAKMLMNGLYGKFGQRGHKWTDCPGWTIGKRWGDLHVLRPNQPKPDRYRAIAGTVQKECMNEEHPQAIPSIAAFVAAHARERMRALRQIAGYGNTLYQATDAIITTKEGYGNLLRANEIAERSLGKLRVKGIHHQCRIAGINKVQLDGDWSLAGRPEDAKQVTRNGFIGTRIEGAESVISRKPDQTVQGSSCT